MPSQPAQDWIGAAEAAERLAVKPASLYSYVSRGVLSRRKAADGRASLFSADEVAALARRGRPRRPGGSGQLTIETALTEISAGQLRYRGLDAVGLAAEQGFEAVASLLWTGDLAEPAAELPWRATPEALAAGAASQAALPPGTLPLERLQVIVPVLAATDPLRLHLDRPAVLVAARGLIAGMVECLPLAGSPAAALRPGGTTIAERLAPRLCPRALSPGLTGALRAALVLLADHELAASTLAVRVAASVRADPYAAVATGLGALGGAMHGGASLGAEVMLGSAGSPADASRVVGDLLRRGQRIPGFGHFVYHGGDPRAVALLSMIRRAAPRSGRLAVADAVLAEARRRALPEPNIDFALATLAGVGGMISGAGEAIFAVARVAGWIAHSLEEYERNAPIRPRAVYIGLPPVPGTDRPG